MLWIKEVEMVDSVDDLKSSLSVRGIRMPNFEVLVARIASALNKIIHNTQFKEKGQSGGETEPEAGPFPSRKTDCLLDLWILPGHWRNFIVYDENPIWWHLGRIVQTKNTRVWETQDRIGIVWPGDSSEEVRTWLSQIEDDGKKKYRAGHSK